MGPQRPASAAGHGEDGAVPSGGRLPARDTVPADDPDGSTGLRTDLADAMHVAARARQGRIASTVDERHAAYLSALHVRAAAEVDGLRASARQETLDVESWAAAELERVREERDRRLDSVQRQFQDRLASHEEHLQAEIARVEEVVRVHREALNAFFEHLDGEPDPSAIAERAACVPALARLGEVDAVDEIGAGDALLRLVEARPTAHDEALPVAPAEAGAEDAWPRTWKDVPEEPEIAAPFEAPGDDDAEAAAWRPDVLAPSDVVEGPAPPVATMAGHEQSTTDPDANRVLSMAAMSRMSGDAARAGRPVNSTDRVRARLRYIAEHHVARSGVEPADSQPAGPAVNPADPLG